LQLELELELEPTAWQQGHGLQLDLRSSLPLLRQATQVRAKHQEQQQRQLS
jgi:hypothetical protein